MKVSAENFKVIPIKKALMFYLIFIITVFFSYQLIQKNVPQSHLLWECLVIFYFVLMTFLGVGSIFYGRKILKHRQSPPPNTWVFSNWRVISGNKAYWSGWLVIFCGVFIAFAFIYQFIVYLTHYV
ncbi:hypothetical protein [Colwellia piezophila]|uniref:hypothetical protein n=1 Tax=Colwellia piezophila TaxID=211668 RepID=UPI0003784914|nr:hypothetical protein [Colwellia piezophila]